MQSFSNLAQPIEAAKSIKDVAHEINNPLAIILTTVEKMEIELARNSATKEEILNKCARIKSTVEKISHILSEGSR